MIWMPLSELIIAVAEEEDRIKGDGLWSGSRLCKKLERMHLDATTLMGRKMLSQY